MGLSPGYAIQSPIFLCTCCITLTSMWCFKGIVSGDFVLKFFQINSCFSFASFEYLQSHQRLRRPSDVVHRRMVTYLSKKISWNYPLKSGKLQTSDDNHHKNESFPVQNQPKNTKTVNISYFFPTMLYIVFVTSLAWYTRTINGMKYKLVYLHPAKLSPGWGLPYMYTESRCKGERSKPPQCKQSWGWNRTQCPRYL